MRPMLIGHSQGGIQAVKVLHELDGAFGDRDRGLESAHATAPRTARRSSIR